MVGFHLSEPDADADGLALWFKGEIAQGDTTLTAAGRTETLTFSVGDIVKGTATFDDGAVHTFDAAPAVKGSGNYDVTFGEDGSYDGRLT